MNLVSHTLAGTADISPNGSNQPVGNSRLKMNIVDLNFFYGKSEALHNINLQVKANHITALIGPSGCRKSTFIRTLNQMYELVRHTRVEGEVTLDVESIFAMDFSDLRRRVGMVLPENQSIPKIHLRECCLRAAS